MLYGVECIDKENEKNFLNIKDTADAYIAEIETRKKFPNCKIGKTYRVYTKPETPHILDKLELVGEDDSKQV